MKLYIELRDHEEQLHREFEWSFTDETETSQLRDEIKIVFCIDHYYQELFFNGARIRSDTMNKVGAKDKDTIIVKHSLLVNWSTYLEQIDRVRNLTTSGATSRRKDLILRGRELLSPLDCTKFFVAYARFLSKREEIDSDINYLIHNTKKYMKRALNSYFSSLFEGCQLELTEKPKKADGVQLGIFVFIKDDSGTVISSYYAKTIGNMPKAEFAPELKPVIDLTELFVYQLLKVIGIGAAEVHLVSDELHSDCIYLATKLIDNFFTASGKTVDHLLVPASSKVDKKQLVIDEAMIRPLKILAALLGLEDLFENKGNYGFVERELRIVDFRVNLSLGSRISKTRQEIPYLEKLFEKWDILNSIDKAKRLIEDDKAIKGSDNLNTDVFCDYIKRIKKTVQDFVNNPKKTSANE